MRKRKPQPQPAEAPAAFDQWRRGRPLRRCPSLACRREGRCLALASSGKCLMTHYKDSDDMAIEATRQIHRFIAKYKRENPGWVEPPDDGSPPDFRDLKKALEQRIADHAAELAQQRLAASAGPGGRRQRRRR